MLGPFNPNRDTSRAHPAFFRERLHQPRNDTGLERGLVHVKDNAQARGVHEQDERQGPRADAKRNRPLRAVHRFRRATCLRKRSATTAMTGPSKRVSERGVFFSGRLWTRL